MKNIKTRYLRAASLFLMLVLTSISFAKMPAVKDISVAINSLVPELSVTDVNSVPKTIKQLSGNKGLVLVLFRSADWCSYCIKHLKEINEWNDRINELGYQVAGISYDSLEILKTFSDKNQLKYPLLHDLNHKTMEDLKVMNDKHKPGDKGYGIPYPGVMVINNEGRLAYKYFYEGYKKRVIMEKLYLQLKAGL
ncbi:MAG: AhpC/TSA family protein [Gammaproteobacteria bacterium]|nr:MAG: AhpC/TSA family protein [Gammaproteobacteria bacterium]